MANRVVPRTAQKSSGQLITGALWNAGPRALAQFMLAPPLFRIRQTSNQSMVSGSWSAMSFNVTDADSDSGHSNVTNNSRYTCQVAGWYYVEGYFAIGSGGATSRFDCAIAKNGTIVGASAQMLQRLSDLQALMSGTLVQLAVGDYVETWGRQNSGVTVGTFDGADLAPAMNGFWVHS